VVWCVLRVLGMRTREEVGSKSSGRLAAEPFAGRELTEGEREVLRVEMRRARALVAAVPDRKPIGMGRRIWAHYALPARDR
jgi:hypothetical protein